MFTLNTYFSTSPYCLQSAMRLYIYQGLDREKVPDDVTHVIVDSRVTSIKNRAFSASSSLVSVIMGDNVKIIEACAFIRCRALRFIRLSNTLELIGEDAFYGCESLEALFLPSTVNSIESVAFWSCSSLRLMILPNDIDLSNVGEVIIFKTGIYQIANNAGVAYERNEYNRITGDSSRRVHEWLIHHMDEAPFHTLCYNSSVTTKQINDHLNENGNESALVIDAIYGMSPLHMLSMNPNAPADTIAALSNFSMKVVFCLDNRQKTPLEYARDYNVGGLIGMINCLCNYRNSCNENSVRRRRKEESSTKKKRRIIIECKIE